MKRSPEEIQKFEAKVLATLKTLYNKKNQPQPASAIAKKMKLEIGDTQLRAALNKMRVRGEVLTEGERSKMTYHPSPDA